MVGHQEQGIGLEVHGQGWVKADASLHNVLDNLVSNAIKHASPSNIRIDIEDKGKTALIRVSDDGIGIPAEARQCLFQEGFKFGPMGNTAGADRSAYRHERARQLGRTPRAAH